jgi:hypothetical protein
MSAVEPAVPEASFTVQNHTAGLFNADSCGEGNNHPPDHLVTHLVSPLHLFLFCVAATSAVRGGLTLQHLGM